WRTGRGWRPPAISQHSERRFRDLHRSSDRTRRGVTLLLGDMERSVKGLLGGRLKPNDPRRFLIEAMIGAMNAGGVGEPRATPAGERQIAGHPLFHGLGPAAARTLIDLSNDAIRFAGGAIGRAPAIAKGLPARIHRLAAFGMAAEVAVADEQLV